MRGGFVFLAAAAALVIVPCAPGSADESGSVPAHKYVGADKCKSCHKKELMGNQHGEWLKGPHSHAFETLKGDDAAKIAKTKAISTPPSETGECLECHSTGHGLPAAAFAKKPLKASDGVQCESCHGPGADYRKKKVMSDRDESIAKGMWEPGKDEKICAACHNDRSPSWDPAVGFDFEAMKKKIAHPIPEDVKGHYLEIVKKRRAEGGAADDDEDEDDDS